MAKRMISQLLVLTVLIVSMAACSKQTEYTNVIPAKATALVSIDVKSLAEKAGLNDKENEAMKEKMLNAFKSSMTAVTFQQLEKIIKNPNESGIDMRSPIYFFTDSSLGFSGAMVAKISDEESLKTSLDVMAKEQICEPVAETNGINFTVAGNTLLAFNPSTILIVETGGGTQLEEAKTTITTLMKQTADNSISKTNIFKKMKEHKGDILFFGSMSALPDFYIQQIQHGLAGKIKLEDISAVGSLSFEKGKIVGKIESYTDNEELKALIKKQEKTIQKINESFLKYFPANTLAFLNVGINGNELYNMLLENEDFKNNSSIARGAQVKELFSSFEGDISVGLLNVTMNSAPTFLAYADVKDGKALDAIYKNKQNLGLSNQYDILQLGKDEYVLKGVGTNVFFGIKNKQMYATNDELVYKNIEKTADKSIKSTAYASDMKGKSGFFVINVEAILELPVVKMVVGFGGEEATMYMNLASKISYLSASSEGQVSEIDLCLKDKNVNALKQIVDFAKQFAGM